MLSIRRKITVCADLIGAISSPLENLSVNSTDLSVRPTLRVHIKASDNPSSACFKSMYALDNNMYN